jgi:hypothetical protein
MKKFNISKIIGIILVVLAIFYILGGTDIFNIFKKDTDKKDSDKKLNFLVLGLFLIAFFISFFLFKKKLNNQKNIVVSIIIAGITTYILGDLSVFSSAGIEIFNAFTSDLKQNFSILGLFLLVFFVFFFLLKKKLNVRKNIVSSAIIAGVATYILGDIFGLGIFKGPVTIGLKMILIFVMLLLFIPLIKWLKLNFGIKENE